MRYCLATNITKLQYSRNRKILENRKIQIKPEFSPGILFLDKLDELWSKA